MRIIPTRREQLVHYENVFCSIFTKHPSYPSSDLNTKDTGQENGWLEGSNLGVGGGGYDYKIASNLHNGNMTV